MPIPRAGALAPAIALALALSVCLPLVPGPVHAADVRPSMQRQAPALSLPARDGTTVTLESLRGRVVLLDFWASWCGPCKSSFPWLASLGSTFPDSDLVVVAVNLDKKRAAADEFLAKHAAPFTVLFDPEGKVAEAFKVNAMPMTFLVGRDGAIVESHPGFDAKKTRQYEDRIREALGR